MSSANGDGAGNLDRERRVSHQKPTANDDHHVSKSMTAARQAVSTRTVDVQVTSRSLTNERSQYGGQSLPVSSPAVSMSSPQAHFGGRQLASKEQIDEYIASEMKEKYMEQTRTLEEIQMKMKQELLDRQTQLVQQLQHMAPLEPTVSSSSPAASTNGYNHAHNGSVDGEEIMANGMSSHSADGSLNGNISQSSHDTWDSTNAFAHERPVLTGSERSTPIATVMPSVGSSNDLELLSQSVHIPVDSKGTEADDSNSRLEALAKDERTVSHEEKDGGSAGTIAAFNEPPTSDSSTPDPINSLAKSEASAARNTLTAEAAMADDTDVSRAFPNSAAADDVACHLSDSSTPPPESPADDLSASLRFSLRQKHSRHLADMKAYYEQELSDLKEKLTSSLAISEHVAYRSLELDNQKLRDRCRILEEELLRANRYINTVDKQMEDLESSFNATLAKPGTQETVESSTSSNELLYKNKLVQAESYIAALEAKNKDLFVAVCDAYEVRDNTARSATQETVRYKELKEKYEEMRASNELTMMKLRNAETSLSESRRDLDSLKHSMERLEGEHRKLARENELLRLADTQSQIDSNPLTKSTTDESPVLTAERQLQKLSNGSVSPSKYRSRQHGSDRSRHERRQPHKTDLNKQCSPQPLSDATQSSDNSTKETASRHRHKHTSKRSAQDKSKGYPAVGKDDLISAYSPIVDRQRHSSSASSGGFPIKSSTSPCRQSVERPFGYHHVGASASPSKRIQHCTVLSPSTRCKEVGRNNREKSSQTSTQSPAMKNLNFSLTSPSSPEKLRISKEDVLDKVRTGKVFADEPEKLSSSVGTNKSIMNSRQQLVSDAERRLDELLVEKQNLKSSLTRLATPHGRKDKERKETLEQQLDRVERDIGSVRLTLRRHNAI